MVIVKNKVWNKSVHELYDMVLDHICYDLEDIIYKQITGKVRRQILNQVRNMIREEGLNHMDLIME